MPETIQQTYSFPARLLIGGILFVTGAFSVIGGQTLLNDFNTSGVPVESVTYIADAPFNAYCTATGGLAKYDACAIQNPVTKRDNSAGSGMILELCMEIGVNHTNVSFDVVEVASLGASSGRLLINNLAGSGSWACATVPTGWGSGKFLVAKTLTAPKANFTGRLRGRYRDVFGE